MHKSAFTLSEVLVTLGIIGIVAGMTLPTLIQKNQKKQTIVRLKKTYSTLQQSIQLSNAKYGDIDGWDWTLDTEKFFETYLGCNFIYTRNCKYTNGCWNKDGAFNLSGGEYEDNPNRNYWVKLKLNDGTLIALQKQDNTHVHIDVDINGYNKPNTFGKDIFVITIVKDKLKDTSHQINKPGLYFFGHGLERNEIINNTLGCKTDKEGLMCGELILIDGWELKKDYPW